VNTPDYSCRAAVTAYAGSVATGKTQALVERVRAALEAGTPAAGLLVFAAAPAAAQALEARLAAACGEAAAGVHVTTPLAFARETLATEPARAFTGGRSHLLASFEEGFFMEDVRVTGVKPRRLKAMLGFLQRGWSEMRDDEDGWLINGEERGLNEFARRRLALMGGVLRAEATAACVRYLASDGPALAAAQRACVFADDLHAMSRASQRLLRMLATRELAVSWDVLGGLAGEEPYGYAEGLAELEQACVAGSYTRVDLQVSHQAVAPHAAVANMLAQECLAGEGVVAPEPAADAAPGAFKVARVPDLANEMPCVAGEVRALVDAGVPAERIAVAAPTDAWARRASAALERAGVASTRIEARQALGGDPRDLSKCAAPLAYTALHLVADPRSATAWRCWCGFGDYLACSTGINQLIDLYGQNGAALPELLDALAANGVNAPNQQKVADRRAAGLALVERAAGKTGPELLAAVCAAALGTPEVPAPLAALLGEVGERECAAELFARAERALLAPAFAPGAVRVCCYDALMGQDPQVLVLCGLANGVVPVRGYFDLAEATMEEQDKMHRRLVGQLAALAGKARDTVLCTTFERAGIVEAETLNLKTERVKLRDGKRVCEMGPSVCIDYLTGKKLSYVR